MRIVTHRLEHAEIRPAAVRRRALLLQHAAHGGGHAAEFGRRGADDLAGDDRCGGLPEQTGLDGLAEAAIWPSATFTSTAIVEPQSFE